MKGSSLKLFQLTTQCRKLRNSYNAAKRKINQLQKEKNEYLGERLGLVSENQEIKESREELKNEIEILQEKIHTLETELKPVKPSGNEVPPLARTNFLRHTATSNTSLLVPQIIPIQQIKKEKDHSVKTVADQVGIELEKIHSATTTNAIPSTSGRSSTSTTKIGDPIDLTISSEDEN